MLEVQNKKIQTEPIEDLKFLMVLMKHMRKFQESIKKRIGTSKDVKKNHIEFP